MRTWASAAGIAAGHPATARAGLEVLAEGGSAADAAVAASLASCVAETVMTGIAGGGHAIWWDAAAGRAELLDCFVAVPGLGLARTPAPPTRLEIPFGEQPVPYAVGIATLRRSGTAGRARGALAAVRAPAVAASLRAGDRARPDRRRAAAAHAGCLAMLEPVMTMREGGAIYSPGGRLLGPGASLRQPGLVRTFELVAYEGAETFYRGTIAGELLAIMDERGGLVTAAGPRGLPTPVARSRPAAPMRASRCARAAGSRESWRR